MKYAIMMQEVVDVAGIFSWEVTMVKLIKGESDLATLHPDLVKEWHPIKNGDLMPEDISSGSGKEVWWLCPEGHTYSMVVNQRTKRGYGCPYCSGHRAIRGINDLATANPELSEEWNYEKNNNLTPYDEAREHLAKALMVFPDDMRLRLLKIQLEIADEHPEAAKEEIVQIKSQGLDAGFRKKIAMEEADIYLREGNPAGIVDSLSWGLEESPGDADLLFIMLNTYIAVLDYDNIIKFADQLLKNEEIDPSAMASAEFYRALSLRQTGKEEEAVAEFKRLTRSLRKLSIDNPESIDIFIYRLLTHNALKEYDKAFELADYLGRVSPDEASVHAFRSLIYKDMGEQENAAAELEMAKRLNPNIKG